MSEGYVTARHSLLIQLAEGSEAEIAILMAFLYSIDTTSFLEGGEEAEGGCYLYYFSCL